MYTFHNVRLRRFQCIKELPRLYGNELVNFDMFDLSLVEHFAVEKDQLNECDEYGDCYNIKMITMYNVRKRDFIRSSICILTVNAVFTSFAYYLSTLRGFQYHEWEIRYPIRAVLISLANVRN